MGITGDAWIGGHELMHGGYCSRIIHEIAFHPKDDFELFGRN